MASLIAIAYPDEATAERVRAELAQASKEYLVELHDAVVVVREGDGKVKLRQAYSTRAWAPRAEPCGVASSACSSSRRSSGWRSAPRPVPRSAR